MLLHGMFDEQASTIACSHSPLRQVPREKKQKTKTSKTATVVIAWQPGGGGRGQCRRCSTKKRTSMSGSGLTDSAGPPSSSSPFFDGISSSSYE